MEERKGIREGREVKRKKKKNEEKIGEKFIT